MSLKKTNIGEITILCIARLLSMWIRDVPHWSLILSFLFVARLLCRRVHDFSRVICPLSSKDIVIQKRNFSLFYLDLSYHIFTHLVHSPYSKLGQYMLQTKSQYIDRWAHPSILLEECIIQLRLFPLGLLCNIIIPLQSLYEICLILE